jgi:hypothetical protein
MDNIKNDVGKVFEGLQKNTRYIYCYVHLYWPMKSVQVLEKKRS